VEIDVEAQPPQKLRVSAWLFVDGAAEGATPLEIERVSVARASAGEVFGRIRNRAYRLAPSTRIRFECLVADELLTDPLDQWKVTEAALRAEIALGELNPVVVRPLSRTRFDTSMAYLRTRCADGVRACDDALPDPIQRLDACMQPNDLVMIVDTTRQSAEELYGALIDGTKPFLVFLERCPNVQSPVDGIHGLLAAGVPAILWLRDGEDPDCAIGDVLATLYGERVTNLPERVYEMRKKKALRFRTRLSLLWDTPDRPSPGTGHSLEETDRRT
jgi:hypothetical protein